MEWVLTMKLPNSMIEVIGALMGDVRPNKVGCAIVPQGHINVSVYQKKQYEAVRYLEELGLVKVTDGNIPNMYVVTAGWKTWQKPEIKKPESASDLAPYLDQIKEKMAKDLGCSVSDIQLSVKV